MRWVVTGGAGYIGSHVVVALLKAGIEPVIIDDLSSGHESFIPEGVTFVRGSLLNIDTLRTAFRDQVDGVIHLAGFKYAGESVSRPLHAYEQNVTATLNLLRVMEETDVKNYVFSSSASVYGTPSEAAVTETSDTHPESPYGETKLIGEWLMVDQVKARALRATALRYFNVVGSGSPQLGDTSPHNLFPLLFKALSEGRTPHVNGVDYDTPDGSCVRDYVHVVDIAQAHVAAAQKLSAGVSLERIYNLGAGIGTSVLEIMTAAATVTGHSFDPEILPRRAGDPARIVASGELAARDLGWANTHPITQMIESAWAFWTSAHPVDLRGKIS
ncbi:MAG: UDP-glucose 4-epimerase GalE [Actinomycetales bacterium]|nr:UDP-glucose 4-epimerase GalE [Actinomycetales bacterium]